MSLSEIRKKNSKGRSLLNRKTESVTYPKELIDQCKNEFNTFVKPIRDSVLTRYEYCDLKELS